VRCSAEGIATLSPMADLLVVDNDARIAELVAWFLEKGGHSARVATSYAEAREILRERRFDLMLADLELGVEDGRVELPLLESEGLLPPTLVVSGYLDAEITEALSEISGIRGTVPKPFEPQELLERVDAELSAAPAPTVETAPEAAGEDLDEFVILAAPAPEVMEPSPAAPEAGSAFEEEEDEWVEILPEKRVDTSDSEGEE